MVEFLAGVFATLTAFFLVGEWGFFLLLGGVFLWTWFLVSSRRGLGALVLIIGTGLFIQFISRLDIWMWVAENWTKALAWAGIYVVAGGLYALFRWNLHATRKSRELGELEADFRKSTGNTGPLNLKQKQAFNSYLYEKRYRPDIEETYLSENDFLTHGVIPTARRNKYVVGRWVWWWPWSALGWFLDDFIRELYEIVSQGLEGLMDYMARRVFGDKAALGLTAEELQTLRREREADEDKRREEAQQRRSGHGRY